jgi:hypothetical protein
LIYTWEGFLCLLDVRSSSSTEWRWSTASLRRRRSARSVS